jgi:hypothetical protein
MVEELTIGGFILGIITLISKYIPVKKAFLGVLVTFLAFFCFDLLSGFTHFKFTKSNEDLIQGLIKIKNDSPKDSVTTKQMNIKIKELSQREHYSTLLSRVLLKVSNSFNQPTTNVPQTQNADTKNRYTNRYSINNVVELFSYKFLSSGWLMIILIIFLNLFFVMTSKSIFESVFCGVFLSFIFLSISLSIANLCDLIPVFYSIYLNYFINFLIGILTPILIIYSCGIFAYQYEDYTEKLGIIMPNPNNYDSFFAYMKGILLEVKEKSLQN